MLIRYLAVWKLHGATKIAPEESYVELAALDDPSIVATVTTDPKPYLFHIDKSVALGAQLLKGIFPSYNEGTLQERLASEIENVEARRDKPTNTGVFLVFEGEMDTSTPEFKVRQDSNEFAVCIDAIEKSEIRTEFRAFVQAGLVALGLSLPPNADRRIEKVGEVVYLIGPDNGKPIYTFTIPRGGARLSIASRGCPVGC